MKGGVWEYRLLSNSQTVLGVQGNIHTTLSAWESFISLKKKRLNFLMVLGIEPRTLHTLGKHSIPSPVFSVYLFETEQPQTM